MLNLRKMIFMAKHPSFGRDNSPMGEKAFNTRHATICVTSMSYCSQIPALVLFGECFKISTSDLLKRFASTYQKEQEQAHKRSVTATTFGWIRISQFLLSLRHLQAIGSNERGPMPTQDNIECPNKRNTGTAIASKKEEDEERVVKISSSFRPVRKYGLNLLISPFEDRLSNSLAHDRGGCKEVGQRFFTKIAIGGHELTIFSDDFGIRCSRSTPDDHLTPPSCEIGSHRRG